MKDVKVGIVGAAGRGLGFFAAFEHNPHTVITALCDINEAGLLASATAHGIEQTYTDYETMLDKSGIDAVVIGTPMHLHASQSIAALERNISVLCEVTAGVSIEECRRVVEAKKKSKATYMMAENYCYTQSVRLVSEIIKAGLLGELYYGEGEYVHEVKALELPTPWRRKWQTGINGNTYCTHPLGPLYQWFGNQRAVSVCCFGSGHHYLDSEGLPYEIEDSITTACRMASGGLVNLRLDMLSERPHNPSYLQIQGTKGCYESPRGLGDSPKIYLMERHEPYTWHPLEELSEEFLPDNWLHPSKEALAAGHGGGDFMQVQDFVDALVEGKEPPIGIYESMDMTLAGLASQISIANGSVWTDVPDPREW